MKFKLADEELGRGVSDIFNSGKDTTEWLGGIYYDAVLQTDLERHRLVSAIDTQGNVVGGSQTAPSGLHRRDMHLVAVDLESRRQGVATKLYRTWELISALEGRVVMTDTPMIGNATMINFLVGCGWTTAVILRSRIKRSGDLVIFHRHVEVDPTWDVEGIEIELREEYTHNYMKAFARYHQRERVDLCDRAFKNRELAKELLGL